MTGTALAIPVGGSDRPAVIDAEDYQLVAPHAWTVHGPMDKPVNYARTNHRGHTLYMHRLIAGATRRQVVDHRNRDGLDNRRANLRVTVQRLNMANSAKQTGTSSIYKGVTFDRRRSRWTAQIMVCREHFFLGRFDSEIAAARAYDAAALAAWGEYARLNFPEAK